MKNYDTFNFSNVLEFENYVLVAAALWKMFTFFWPALVIVGIIFWLDGRNDVFHEKK